jgi:UDP-GlcNAc3NAcA epimerase
MSDIFFEELAIPRPGHRLDIHGGSHGEMTGRMLAALEAVILAERPDAVLVYGDTNSTLAGALAAAKLVVPLIHVEAGLRSYNKAMPEEINRLLTDHVSDLLLCPTRRSVENLRREGIERNVHQVGDVMHDATLQMLPIAERRSNAIERLGLRPQRYAVATVHRAENTDDAASMRRAFDFLAAQARERPVVVPLHPRTRLAAERFGVSLDDPALRLIEPLGYLDMCRLIHHAAIVFTDSGGMQKEAYFHRVPCVTMRGETEWVETIEHGWNRLWTEETFRPRSDIPDYASGDAAGKMARLISEFLAS